MAVRPSGTFGRAKPRSRRLEFPAHANLLLSCGVKFTQLVLEEFSMRKALIPWLLSSALVAVPVASAHAETSVACMYMLMRVYKAEMDYCKVPLAKDRDARYERLRTGLESFIRANAKQDPDKIFSGIENSNIKRALAGL